jgi:DNA repair exonuclease SbcCD nuclease subunit
MNTKDVIMVHSSDLHVDHDYTARLHGGDGTAGLKCVLHAARAIGADVVLLAGDTFESHRLPQHVLDRTASVIAAAGLPVVLLPGNHDPAIPEAVFRRGMLAAVDNLMVLGVTHPEAVDLPHLELEIWGRAHRHYDPAVDRSVAPRPSWLINDDEITATGADYVALGHWNRALKVGNGPVAAYYSGSPEYAGTVNVVRLTSAGQVLVERMELDIPREVEPVYVP